MKDLHKFQQSLYKYGLKSCIIVATALFFIKEDVNWPFNALFFLSNILLIL